MNSTLGIASWWLADIVGLALTFILPSNLPVYRDYNLTLPHIVLVPLLYGLVSYLYGPDLKWYLWRLCEVVLLGFLMWNMLIYVATLLQSKSMTAGQEEEEESDDE